MWRYITQGLIFTAISLFGLVALWLLQQQTQTITLKIAAGNKSSDSYQLMKVATEKLHQRLPRLKFELLETSGSKQNMQLLAEKRVQLVTVQADIMHDESARLIASLYSDYYQLLVRKESAIDKFADLEGKQIALAEKGSGQYSSFILLATHYGLDLQSMNLLSLSTQAAHQALLNSQVDAVFRVRTLTHRNTLQLLSHDAIDIKAIHQAKNISLKNAHLEHNILPKGIYQTSPMIPAEDLPTLSVQRLLMTHKDMDQHIIYHLTRALFEEKYAISRQAPLARFIQHPYAHNDNPLLPLHSGSERYYNKTPFSFLQVNATPMLIMLFVFISLILYLRHVYKKQKIQFAQSLHKDVIHLMNDAEQQLVAPAILQKKLNQLLNRATQAQTKGQLSSENFQAFAFHWQIAHNKMNTQPMTPQTVHKKTTSKTFKQ